MGQRFGLHLRTYRVSIVRSGDLLLRGSDISKILYTKVTGSMMQANNTKQKVLIVIFSIVISSFLGLVVGFFVGDRGIPFLNLVNYPGWSIGVLVGSSPFSLEPPQNIRNPVLTADDVSDINAKFVADPFLVKYHDKWYMFFEAYNSDTKAGDIGVASSVDGLNWVYGKIVLHEPFSLSYPYVFEWDGDYYMIPGSREVFSVRLYKAEVFPTKWIFVKNLILGHELVDNSVFEYGGKWWMFATFKGHAVLSLYFADSPLGPWRVHPKSPLIRGNAHIARSAGRVLVLDDRIYRFAQDDAPVYGQRVYAFEITRLSETEYEEQQIGDSAILGASGNGWNGGKMHHVDAHRIGDNNFLAVVDGAGRERLEVGVRKYLPVRRFLKYLF